MERLKKPLLKTLGAILALLALTLGARYAEEQNLGGLFGGVGERALALWTKPVITIGSTGVSPMFLFEAAVYLALLYFFARGARSLLQHRIFRHSSIDPGLQYALETGAGYLVFIFGLIIGLQSVGINLSSLAFLTGIIGVGVGFGLQNIVNNFVSGLILLVERPVKVGDRVELGDLMGDVVQIGPRSTWVKTNDNIVIIVPNSDFISNRVTNWTANDRIVRISVPVGAGYASDPEQVREILLRVAKEQTQILKDPAPDVIFQSFGDNSLNFELRVWTEHCLRTPKVLRSDLYYAIFRAFAENGIEIPFPQRDIHVRSFDAPGPLRIARQRSDAPGPAPKPQ